MNTPAVTSAVAERSEQTWLEETRVLLQNRPNRIRLKDIAGPCGLSVAWLSKLQTNSLPDYPISKVQKLNRWLRENAVNA